MSGTVGAVSAVSTIPAGSKGGHGMSFGEVLSCLNPLQYVPVVGTIYRAITGDTIPAPVREVGSLVFSGLTSGPVGIGISLGMDAAERAVGFDEEKFGQSMLAAIGIGHASPSGAMAVASSPPAPTQAAPSSAFTPADLAQFGLTQGADGSVVGHGLSGADALNAMELSRIATTAYARAGASAPA